MADNRRRASPAILKGVSYLLIASLVEAAIITYVLGILWGADPSHIPYFQDFSVVFLPIFTTCLVLFLIAYYLALSEARRRSIHPIIYFFALTAGVLFSGIITVLANIFPHIIPFNDWMLFWSSLPLTMFAGWLAVALAGAAERSHANHQR